MSRARGKTEGPSQRERVAQLREQLAVWQEQYDEEEVAAIAAMFQGYSGRNALLIAMQCPTATEVHGFKAWLEFGRVVRKGEHGIQILAPAGRVEAPVKGAPAPADGGEGGEGEGATRTRQLFRLAYVFDVAQTDVIEQPSAEVA